MHLRRVSCLTATFLAPIPLVFSQSSSELPQFEKRTVTAVRMYNAITVDGKMNEAEWKQPVTLEFKQRDPNEGQPATQRTDVWVAYDDAALYIGAKLYDTHPDSIISKLGRRDAFLTSDWFYVGVDSYHDKRSGYFFAVYPSGTLIDGRLYNDSWDDNSWDGVWEAATSIDSEGWNVEIRIPYSQIRFSAMDEHVLGIQFSRMVQRNKEEMLFPFIKKGSGIWVSGFADLVGIKNIEPPARVEVLPYAAGSSEALVDDPGNPFRKNIAWNGNAGADVKFGLGSNLTVNATINPDFGQVEVDPAVVNLTQFETFFQEKRPFFIEGSDYFSFGFGGSNNFWGFNFGNPDFFYSRRIGRSPRGDAQHDGYSDVPANTTILGAAKISGKIFDNVTFGTLHAFTQREHARVDSSNTRFNDVVEPFSYYGVTRALKEFDNGRHGIGMIATTTIHDLHQPYLLSNFNKQSWSAGIDGWVHLDSAKAWVVTGFFAGSFNTADKSRMITLQRDPLRYYQRPDQDYVRVDSNATSLSGYMSRVMLNKQSGNFRINAAFGAASPGFEINELGYQFRADAINGHVVVGYTWFEPDGLFRRKGFNVATARTFDYGGRRVYDVHGLLSNVQFMNYWGLNMNFFFNPQYIDIRNTRGGPAMLTTHAYGLFLYGYTDEGKDLSLDLELGGGRSESGGYQINMTPGIEWKGLEGLLVRVSPTFFRDVTIAQFVDNIEDPTATHTFGTRHVFGKLDQKEFSAVVRVNWTFSPTLSLQMFIQPLISVGTYDQFKELKQPLTYSFNTYGERGSTITPVTTDGKVTDYTVTTANGRSFSFGNPDFNYKSFRANAVLRWEYMSGSTLFFAWTHGHVEDSRNIGQFKPFFRDINSLFRTEPDNVFLVKIAYWLTPSALGL